MKFKNSPPRSCDSGSALGGPAWTNRRYPLAALILPFALALTGAGCLRAASATYTGTAGDNNFDTGTNWSTGTAPGDTTVGDTTNQDIATFSLATGATITEATQRNLLGITFGGAGGFTIGTTTGAAFLLSSGGSILANGSSVSQTVNAPLVLENAAAAANGTYTFESDTPGTSRTTTIGGSVTGAATSGSTVLTLTGTSAGTGGAGNTISGAIADGSGGGTLAISKTGTGTWALNGANTFTGGVTVTAGTLRTTEATSTSAFGTGTITLNGGTVAFAATTSTITNAFAINAGTTSFLSAKGGTFSPSAMSGTGNLTFTPNGTGITDSFTDFKNFAGTVEVANSLFLRAVTGYVTTSLQNANLVLDTGGTFNVNFGTNSTNTFYFGSLAGGGTIGGSAAGGGTFTFQVGGNNASTTFSGTVVQGSTGTALTKAGTGTLTLSGTNTYAGVTTVSGGALAINSDASLGAVATGATTTINGGALVGNASFTLDNAGANLRAITLGASGGTLAATTGNTMTIDGFIGGAALTVGTGALTVNGAATTGNGTVVLTGANGYTGGTTLNAGTLNINGIFALGGANYAGITFNGGTLQYAAGTGTAFSTAAGGGDISNFGGVKTVTISAGGATIDTNNNNVTYASPIGNGGAGALTKVGAGVLTFAAANTYSGGTNVNADTLAITANGGLGTGNVTIAAGANLTLSTGVTAAHNGALTTTLTLASTTSVLELDGTGVQDTVGSLVVNGAAVLPGTYGAPGTIGETASLPEIIGTGLVLVAVPEPSTWALMLGGAVGAGVLAARRRRCA